MSQQISELNSSEREWLAGNVELASEIAKAYGLAVDAANRLDPGQLDMAWAAWMASHDRTAEDPNPYINAFGLALGTYLVDQFNLEWKVVQDEHGTEMALWGCEGDILVFPANLVSKRYIAGTTGFFADVAAKIESDVTKIRSVMTEGRSTGLGRFFGGGR